MPNSQPPSPKIIIQRIREELLAEVPKWPQRTIEHKTLLDFILICDNALDQINKYSREKT